MQFLSFYSVTWKIYHGLVVLIAQSIKSSLSSMSVSNRVTLLTDSSTPPIFSQFQPGSPIVDLMLMAFSAEIIFPCLAETR